MRRPAVKTGPRIRETHDYRRFLKPGNQLGWLIGVMTEIQAAAPHAALKAHNHQPRIG